LKKRLYLLIISLLSFACTKEIIQQKLITSATPVNGGAVSPASNSFEKGTQINVIATPNGEYLFKQWQGNLNGNNNPSPLVLDADKQVIGVFEKRQYPLNLSIEGNGTVKEEIISIANNSQYPSGTTVKLTPLPVEKFEFLGWSGDITSTANPLELTINTPINLKATFQKVKFMGYKVDPNARQLGTRYWENTAVLSDLMVGVFQKNFEVFGPPQGDAYCVFTFALCNGDFNNDGYIDVFNAGTAFGAKKANLTFLLWNPTSQRFEEKNLINDKTDFIGAPTKVSPVYLNGDNYVDLVIHGHADEGRPNSNEPVTICISDGKGGYDLTKLTLEPKYLADMFTHEHGDIADLNRDKLPDLLVVANSHSYIFWGIPTFPYFNNKNYVDMPTNFAFYSKMLDVNKDGHNDLIIATNVNNKILLNNGKGEFLDKEISIPYSTTSTNTMNVFDYILDDLNGDGLNDLINVNATEHKNWKIEVYIQQKDGQFKLEDNWIQYTINLNRGNNKNKLIYYDFNGDGLKDITYSESALNPYTNPDNDMKKKTVFIRSGNSFIEKDFFQFDSFAKDLKDQYYK